MKIDCPYWTIKNFFRYLCSAERPSWSSTAARMGSIIAVVAAFEIHMERKAVGTMKPSMILYTVFKNFAILGNRNVISQNSSLCSYSR